MFTFSYFIVFTYVSAYITPHQKTNQLSAWEVLPDWLQSGRTSQADNWFVFWWGVIYAETYVKTIKYEKVNIYIVFYLFIHSISKSSNILSLYFSALCLLMNTVSKWWIMWNSSTTQTCGLFKQHSSHDTLEQASGRLLTIFLHRL